MLALTNPYLRRKRYNLSDKEEENFEWGITTLAGAKPSVIKRLGRDHNVDPSYRKRWRNSKLVAYIINFLGIFDRISFSFKKKHHPKKAPIFIIGHWRSGTTLMHNLICDITDSSYCSTYQNIFPNNLFAFYGLLRGAIQRKMPDTRPADGVKMHTLYPQEEKFALGNMFYHSFYYWMFFPNDTEQIARRFLLQTELSASEKDAWLKNYKLFVTRTSTKRGGEQFISKNPPNTARVKEILSIYPDAKFIFLHRNIYDTLSSTHRFYKGVLPAQQHQNVKDEVLMEQILDVYSILHDKYLADRQLIPEGNLVELSFSEFQLDPLNRLTEILDRFGTNYELSEEVVKKYTRSEHKTKEYKHDDEYVSKVNQRLGKYFEVFGYEMIKNEK